MNFACDVKASSAACICIAMIAVATPAQADSSCVALFSSMWKSPPKYQGATIDNRTAVEDPSTNPPKVYYNWEDTGKLQAGRYGVIRHGPFLAGRTIQNSQPLNYFRIDLYQNGTMKLAKQSKELPENTDGAFTRWYDPHCHNNVASWREAESSSSGAQLVQELSLKFYP